MFAMPAACGSAQHVQTQSVVIHAHLLQRNCAKDKSGSFLVHVDDHALIRSLSHTLTLFWPLTQSQQGELFATVRLEEKWAGYTT